MVGRIFGYDFAGFESVFSVRVIVVEWDRINRHATVRRSKFGFDEDH